MSKGAKLFIEWVDEKLYKFQSTLIHAIISCFLGLTFFRFDKTAFTVPWLNFIQKKRFLGLPVNHTQKVS